MDVFAVYDAAGTAIGRARSGLGPTMLECKTYRYYGHAAFDNPKNYRTTEEEDAWKARDVLAGFRERVTAEGAARRGGARRARGGGAAASRRRRPVRRPVPRA